MVEEQRGHVGMIAMDGDVQRRQVILAQNVWLALLFQQEKRCNLRGKMSMIDKCGSQWRQRLNVTTSPQSLFKSANLGVSIFGSDV